MGIQRFESDSQTIQASAQNRRELLQKHVQGAHADIAEQLIREVQRAEICLLDTDEGPIYTHRLRIVTAAIEQWSEGLKPTTATEMASAMLATGLRDRATLSQSLLATRYDQSIETAIELASHCLGSGLLTNYQASELLAGRTGHLIWGSREILQPIGRGGMGHVYKALNRSLQRFEAIKALNPGRLNSLDAVARFENEAITAAKVKHPNVIDVYDANREGEAFYIVMEYIDGQDLSQHVKQLVDSGTPRDACGRSGSLYDSGGSRFTGRPRRRHHPPRRQTTQLAVGQDWRSQSARSGARSIDQQYRRSRR